MGFFDRRSLAEIKSDNERLRNEREVRGDFEERNAEQKEASRENFNLKHGGKVRVVKNVGKGVGWVGRGVGAGITALGNQYAKAQASKQPQKPKRKRRVKKVKKKSKASPKSFTISYN